METSVEALEGNKVKLSIEVGEEEFEPHLEDAFRRIAREVRIPGFRPGKAPRRVLEARFGTGVAREEALRETLPDYYARALSDHDVDAIAPPEIDITSGQEEGPVQFDAVVEVRPRITVGGYESLRVTIPRPEPSDEEIDAQLDRLREQSSTLEPVKRGAVDGDRVLIDIQGTQDGEVLDGLTADDYSYEVGAGAIPIPEIDENLRGAKAGDILEFDAAHPDPDESDLRFRVLVKEVEAKVLPEPTDEWAAEASEFETVAELRADLEGRWRMVKAAQAQMALQQKSAEALADLVDEDVPEAMVANEVQDRLQDLALRLSAQGATVEQYLSSIGKSQEELLEELRAAAEPAVRVDLALRAVADAEGIEADEEDLAQEYERLGERLERPVEEVRAQFESSGQVSALRSDIRKRKALDWVIERVEIVDEDGEPVDRASLEIPEDEAGEPSDEADVAEDQEDANPEDEP